MGITFIMSGLLSIAFMSLTGITLGKPTGSLFKEAPTVYGIKADLLPNQEKQLAQIDK